MEPSSPIAAEIRTRIVDAAVALFEQGCRQTWPTVDAVRRAAKVDMNAASTVMREWRRAQTAQVAPVAVQIPEPVQQASGRALAALWQQAQELANDSLRAAQAGWEKERTELDAMRQELATAYETQAAELDALQARLAAAEQSAQEAARSAAAELAGMRAELASVTTRAERAEAAGSEIERRASDLRAELDRAHQEADQVRAEIERREADLRVELDRAHQDADQVRVELVQARAQRVVLEAERDQVQKAVGEARERAAGLAGQVEALQGQNADLLAVLKPAVGKPVGKGKQGRLDV